MLILSLFLQTQRNKPKINITPYVENFYYVAF